jgi:hypothetical protein
MKSVRSIKTTYTAAFLLGGLIALLIAQPARSADRFSPLDQADAVPVLRPGS